MAEKYSVAIDGPSGAGKSTLAKAAAAALGICYVDTGAIYRTIGYGVYRRGIDPSDAGAVAAVLPDMQLEMRAEVPLLAQADVSASRFLVAKAAVEAFFAKTWVKLALVAIVVLVIVFVLWLKLGRRSRRYGSRGGKRRQQRAYRGRRRW